jgi:hypothetical protein
LQSRWRRLHDAQRRHQENGHNNPKTKLALPDLDPSKAAVLESLRSPESKRGYRHAIYEFILVLFGAETLVQ